MRLRRKIPTFIFGVSIGLVLGLGFFLFKINDIFNRLKDSAKQQITVIQQPVKTEKTENTELKKNRERFKINLSSSTRVNYREADSLIKEDSELNVATDELQAIKNVKLIRIDENEQDTLAKKNAELPSNLYFIEFWKTPLNSKGYRFTKNKVMMYGFIDFSNVQLYQLEDEFYIKCSNQVFKITQGSEFKPLERVADAGLLAKLN